MKDTAPLCQCCTFTKWEGSGFWRTEETSGEPDSPEKEVSKTPMQERVRTGQGNRRSNVLRVEMY